MAWVATAIVVGTTLVSGAVAYDAAEEAEDRQYAQGEEAKRQQAAALRYNKRELRSSVKDNAALRDRLNQDRLSAAEAYTGAQRDAEEQYETQRTNLNPYIEAGARAVSDLQNFDTGSKFERSDFMDDEGYQFRLSEGQKALERSAAARGGALSGRVVKETERFAQGTASAEYEKAFERFNTGRKLRFDTLSSLAASGLTGTGQLNDAAVDYGKLTDQRVTGLTNISGQYAQTIQDLARLRREYAELNQTGKTQIGNIGIGQGNTAAGARIAQGDIFADTISDLGSTAALAFRKK